MPTFTPEQTPEFIEAVKHLLNPKRPDFNEAPRFHVPIQITSRSLNSDDDYENIHTTYATVAKFNEFYYINGQITLDVEQEFTGEYADEIPEYSGNSSKEFDFSYNKEEKCQIPDMTLEKFLPKWFTEDLKADITSLAIHTA